MDIQFSTRGIAASRRSDAWHAAIARAYFPLDLAFRDAAHFDGRLAIWQIGEVSLSRLTSEALSYHRHRGHLRGVTGDEEFLVTVPVRAPVSFRQCGKEVFCRPGGFILERSHEPYDFAHAQAADLWVLKVGAPLLAARLRAPDRFCSVAFDAGSGAGGLLADMLPLLPARLASLGPEARAVVGRQLVDLIGLAVSEDPRTLTAAQSSVRMAHLARIETLVRRRLSDPALDAEAIAAGAGISVRYLHDLFRDTGQPLGQWIRAQRLEAARAALDDPGNTDSLASIAYASGFGDQSQFSRAFRAAFGVAPSSYRLAARAHVPNA